MKKIIKNTKAVTPEKIARLADRGQNVSHFFKDEGRMFQSIQRINVDPAAGMLKELAKRDETRKLAVSH